MRVSPSLALTPPMGRKRYDMFRESLLENTIGDNSRRRWTTLTSFLLQMLAAIVCIAIPLLYPDTLPTLNAFRGAEFVMPPSGGPPRPVADTRERSDTTNVTQREDALIIREPNAVPRHTDPTPDPHESIEGNVGPYIPGGLPINTGDRSRLLAALIATPPVHATVKQAASAVRRSPGVQQGLLLSRVEPKYPPIARTSRIQGDVVLAAVIGKDGHIENLHLVSGHPLLAEAALDAVKQWRYRPYMLGTEPVEVETQITVRFRLSGAE